MPTITIKTWMGSPLHEGEHENLKAAVESCAAAGASLDDASLNRASLDDASLNGASLSRASLNDASLDDASLNGAILNDASLDDASLNGASLDDASLNRASLDGASLNGASLNRASLNDASLNDASLNDASLNGASLNGASLNDASLNRASLNGAILNDASLKGATFLMASLADVNWGDEERENGPLVAFFCQPWVPAEEARAKDAAMARFASVRPQEVAILRDRLIAGMVDGSQYETGPTECGCLVGTLEFAATAGGAPVELDRNYNSPYEQWFMHIRPGHKPQWNGRARVAIGWCDEHLAAHPAEPAA